MIDGGRCRGVREGWGSRCGMTFEARWAREGRGELGSGGFHLHLSHLSDGHQDELLNLVLMLRTYGGPASKGRSPAELAAAFYYLMARQRELRGCNPLSEQSAHAECPPASLKEVENLAQLAPLALNAAYQRTLVPCFTLHDSHCTVVSIFSPHPHDFECMAVSSSSPSHTL